MRAYFYGMRARYSNPQMRDIEKNLVNSMRSVQFDLDHMTYLDRGHSYVGVFNYLEQTWDEMKKLNARLTELIAMEEAENEYFESKNLVNSK